ncbi:hypothetical protein [Cellulosimicrobium cellulans]|uniref:hypothetical protein n=1 Tax=Cellulosimicrobium cellulans TaxID=1710 RepID=UPI000A58D8F1|nr:hypothetical protein [Cellulosimicrobium cellulans]
MTRLVLLHGRDNAGLDAEELERTWLAVLRAGLDAAGTPRDLADDDASFVFYGDALAALTGRADVVPPVTVHAVPGSRDADGADGADGRPLDLPEDELAFLVEVAREVLHGAGVDDAQVRREADGAVAAQGLGVDLGDLGGWANALLSALDRHVPGLSGAVLLLLVRDVWAYVNEPAVRRAVDEAVVAAMPTDEPAVVVAHSLGSVVAYAVLRDHDRDVTGRGGARWDVPLLLTLGSPLAVRAVRDVLAARAPLRVPGAVRRWVAARDLRDALALHDLGPSAFPLEPGSPPIEDLVVDNRAPGHHAAAVLLDGRTPAGYLAVPEVAHAVGTALPGETAAQVAR